MQVDEDIFEAYEQNLESTQESSFRYVPWNRAFDNLALFMECGPHDFAIEDASGKSIALASSVIRSSSCKLLVMLLEKGFTSSKLPFSVSEKALRFVREILYFNFIPHAYSYDDLVELILVFDYFMMPNFITWASRCIAYNLQAFNIPLSARNDIMLLCEYVPMDMLSVLLCAKNGRFLVDF